MGMDARMDVGMDAGMDPCVGFGLMSDLSAPLWPQGACGRGAFRVETGLDEAGHSCPDLQAVPWRPVPSLMS